MFRSILITAVLLAKLMSCTDSISKENATNKAPRGKRFQQCILQTIFRFSTGSKMFFDANGIPYQYHVPRVELIMEDLNNGCVKIHTKEYRPHKRRRVSALNENEPVGANGPIKRRRVDLQNNFCWRLAASTRAPTDRELESENLWRRDSVPLNRLLQSLESPVFLGHFFYALTSLTEVNGRSTLSRFYYAPVLTARYGCERSGSTNLTVKDIELNVFSICLEPSDAPEDEAVPLMHRPQRIIDVGVRNSRNNVAYDVREKLRENSTDKLNEAEKQFSNMKWDLLFSDPALITFRRLPANNSPYYRVKTPFGDYFDDSLVSGTSWLAAFHGYDFHNGAYVFAHGPGSRCNFYYTIDDIKLLIFLNPKAYFKNENKLWNVCVDLWQQEMHARHGTDLNSRLVHPHAYLSESASIAPYYEMLPRYEALGKPQDMSRETLRRVGQPRKPGGQRKLQYADNQRMPKKRTAEDMRSKMESQRTASEPYMATNMSEPSTSRLARKRHLPASTESVTSEPINPWPCEAEKSSNEPSLPASGPENNGRLGRSGAGCGNGSGILEMSGMFNNEVYAPEYGAGGLPLPADFGNIDEYPNGIELFDSADSALDWLVGTDLYDAASGLSGVFYEDGGSTTGARDRWLHTESEYAMLPSGGTYDSTLLDNLRSEPDYGDMEADLPRTLQVIDGETCSEILDSLCRVPGRRQTDSS